VGRKREEQGDTGGTVTSNAARSLVTCCLYLPGGEVAEIKKGEKDRLQEHLRNK